MSRIDLTPLFEHLFATSKIKSAEDLQLLIDTLRGMDEKDLDMKELIEITGRMQAKSKEKKK